MKSFLSGQRSSGILAHITSLPSDFGIGDIGCSSYRFIDFLEKAGQQYWQILPVGPTHTFFDNSPYMCCSAFAGNPLLICCELLAEDGLINKSSLENHPEFKPYTTQYNSVASFKRSLLEEAFKQFTLGKNEDFAKFIAQTEWLDDYALFMALKEKYSFKGWFDWPRDIGNRNPKVIQTLHTELKTKIDYFRFEQYVFFSQWKRLRTRAENKSIQLIGDIPIYVGVDSVDVWANQDIFLLDPDSFLPTHVAGVPPDYFSKTGQRWGNPLYRWNSKDKKVTDKLYGWWKKRVQSNFKLTDVARIDHFRGFANYWSIPADEETAVNGEWLKGPGEDFFTALLAELDTLPIIAEDLGIITEDVVKLLDNLGFPGMKILQFAFDDKEDNSFLPHNFSTQNCVVYTGTHDNDTTLGWFLSDSLTEEERERIKLYANREHHDHSPIYHDLIHLAFGSIAALAIIPLQDVLGYGSDCRMNTPSTSRGNWSWRCTADALKDETAQWLKRKTVLFGRANKEQLSQNRNET